MRYPSELGLTPERCKVFSNSLLRGGWLVPYRRVVIPLKLPLASAKLRLDELIRDGEPKRLELAQNYWVWIRDWGLVLFARPSWVNLYSPVLTLRLCSHEAGTAAEIAFIAPGFLLLLVWLVCAAGLLGKFRYWGAISEMSIAMFGVHVVSYVFYRREVGDILANLDWVFGDVATR
jgi:hypothetical protein